MGYFRHHAIVVHTWNEDHIKEAHDAASKIFKWVSPIGPKVTNGYRSFFIPTDGSKEGWDESNAGDIRRNSFVLWLHSAIKEGKFFWWAEVQYDDDAGESKVMRHNDDKESENAEEEERLKRVAEMKEKVKKDVHHCGCEGNPQLSLTPVSMLSEAEIKSYGDWGHFHCEFCGKRFWEGGSFFGFCLLADARRLS